MKRYETGILGERLAEEWLCAHGMACVDRRVRAEDGELDLVMHDGSYLVFVEVKYRPSSPAGEGLIAVGTDKQRRMLHAAQAYLIRHECPDMPVRFDVIEITKDGVRHVPDAFRSF